MLIKTLLKKANITFNESTEETTNEKLNEDVCIKDTYITDILAAYFLTLFQGRRDVYALRGAKGGYFPQCFNRWKDYCPKQNKKKISCQECPYREWKKLDESTQKVAQQKIKKVNMQIEQLKTQKYMLEHKSKKDSDLVYALQYQIKSYSADYISEMQSNKKTQVIQRKNIHSFRIV